jgi:hypothetical protein
MKWLVKLTLLLLLTNCSATWHLKKAVQKDPTILEKDTLVVKDTVVVPPVVTTDTVTLSQHDTITIQKDRLKVQLVKVNDTVIINAECASDTIVRTIEVPYEKVIYVQQKTLWEKIQTLAFYIALVFLALAFIRRLIDKYLLNG